MTEQIRPTDTDDVEGHGLRHMGDAERDEADDVEGHGLRHLGDAERDEADDVEGHMPRVRFADAEAHEADDAEGHMPRIRLGDEERQDADDAGEPADADGEEDVAGHLSPRPTGVHDPVSDDAEGRRFPAGSRLPAGGEDEDDVAGHGLRPTDPKRM